MDTSSNGLYTFANRTLTYNGYCLSSISFKVLYKFDVLIMVDDVDKSCSRIMLSDVERLIDKLNDFRYDTYHVIQHESYLKYHPKDDTIVFSDQNNTLTNSFYFKLLNVDDCPIIQLHGDILSFDSYISTFDVDNFVYGLKLASKVWYNKIY